MCGNLYSKWHSNRLDCNQTTLPRCQEHRCCLSKIFKTESKTLKNPQWGALATKMLCDVSNPAPLLPAFPCSLWCWEVGRPMWITPATAQINLGEKQRPTASWPGQPGDPLCLLYIRHRMRGKGCSTRFGELQPMDSSPGCCGRAWPACEKGRGRVWKQPSRL